MKIMKAIRTKKDFVEKCGFDPFTKDFVKEHVITCLRPVTKSETDLTYSCMDLEAYFRVRIDKDMSYVITKEMLDILDLTGKDLITAGFNNSFKDVSFMSLEETMGNILFQKNNKEDDDKNIVSFTEEVAREFEKCPEEPKVLTNKEMNYGAGLITNLLILRIIGNIYEKDFFIIPSSVHEVIIMPVGFGMSISEIKEMIISINKGSVSLEDKLSDNLYFYFRETEQVVQI